MRNLLISTLILQLLLAPLAQAQVKAHVEKESLFSPVVVVVDGKKYYRHFFTGFSDLSEAMRSNPEAVAYAERARKQMLTGSALIWGGLAGAIGYSIVQANSEGRRWNPGTYWTIFLVGFIPGVFFHSAGEMNTLKAINAYNGVGARYSKLIPDRIVATPVNGGAAASLRWSF